MVWLMALGEVVFGGSCVRRKSTIGNRQSAIENAHCLGAARDKFALAGALCRAGELAGEIGHHRGHGVAWLLQYATARLPYQSKSLGQC